MAKRGLAAGLATACLFLLGAEASAAPWQTAQAEPRAVPQPLLLAPPPRLDAPVPAPRQPLSEDLRPLPEANPAVAPGRDPLSQPRQGGTETVRPGEATVAPVKSGEIDRLDPESSGTLDDTNGGLGIDLWNGTRRGLVERLLPMLPSTPRSRVARQLTRRLLLTAARPPEGEPVDAVGPSSLLARRVELLLDMGLADDAAELVRMIPASELTGQLARTRVEALMHARDTVAACGDVESRIAEAGDTFWMKVLIFCQAKNKELDKAALGVELLRETDADDRSFYSLIDALSGYGEVAVEDVAEASPLYLAMLSAAGLPLPAGLDADDQPSVLRLVARSAGAPIETRLEAAERAVAMAVLAPAKLAEIYALVEFSEQQLSDPFAALEELTGGQSRALLFQAATRQNVPTARAEVLKRLWRWAADAGGYVTTARVTAPLLQELEPGPELAWLAADAGRSFYVAGLGDAARPWVDLVRREAPADPEAAKMLAGLWPLARITDADPETGVPWDASLLAAWRDAALDEGAVGSERATAAKVGALLTMLDALGDPIIGGDWQVLYSSLANQHEPMPPPWVWFGLRGAAERGLRGEALLFTLLSLGEGDLADLSPVVLHHIIVSLRLVGLDREARALALEAAVAKGI